MVHRRRALTDIVMLLVNRWTFIHVLLQPWYQTTSMITQYLSTAQYSLQQYSFIYSALSQHSAGKNYPSIIKIHSDMHLLDLFSSLISATPENIFQTKYQALPTQLLYNLRLATELAS